MKYAIVALTLLSMLVACDSANAGLRRRLRRTTITRSHTVKYRTGAVRTNTYARCPLGNCPR